LWMAALEIIEHDAVDASPKTEKPKTKAPAKMLNDLVDKVEANGRDMIKLLDYFKVSAIGDLTKEQAQQAIDMLS